MSVFLVKLLAGRNAGTLAVILAGVAVTSLAGAFTALALNLSPNPFAAMEIVFWMLGSLADRSMTHVALSAPFILIGWVMLLALGRSLDSLTLGADAAATMGVNLVRVQLLLCWAQRPAWALPPPLPVQLVSSDWWFLIFCDRLSVRVHRDCWSQAVSVGLPCCWLLTYWCVSSCRDVS